MKLNETNYVHVKIRKMCQIIAYYSGMEQITDLSKDFKDIRFTNHVSYLTIDYKRNTCFSMCHRITKEEQELIEELMIYLNWLDTGYRVHKRLTNVTKT